MPLYQPFADIDIKLESFLVKKTKQFLSSLTPLTFPVSFLEHFFAAFLRKTVEKLPDFIINFSVVFKKQLLTAKMQWPNHYEQKWFQRCTELQDRALGDGTSPSEDVEKQRSPRKMFHPNVPHKLALDLVSIHLLKILIWARTENTRNRSCTFSTTFIEICFRSFTQHTVMVTLSNNIILRKETVDF